MIDPDPDAEKRQWRAKMVARQTITIWQRPPAERAMARAYHDTGPWSAMALGGLIAFSVGFFLRLRSVGWDWSALSDDLDQFLKYGVAGGIAVYIVTLFYNWCRAPYRQRDEARCEFMQVKQDHVNVVIDRMMEPFAYPLKYPDGSVYDDPPLTVFLMLRMSLNEDHGVGWQTLARHLRDGRWKVPLNNNMKYRLMLILLANLGVIERAGRMEYFSEEGIGESSVDTKYVMSSLGHAVMQRLAEDDILPPFRIDIEEPDPAMADQFASQEVPFHLS